MSTRPGAVPYDLAELDALGGAAAYGDLLRDIMDNPKLRPVLDQTVSGLVRGLQRVGVLEPAARAVEHARQIGIGSALVSSLPAFPEADVADLLDAKRELEVPRLRFRAAVNAYVQEVQSQSWDGPVFEADLRDLQESVELVRRDLIESIEATGLARSARKAASEPLGVAGLTGAVAAFTVGVGGLVPALANVAEEMSSMSTALGGLGVPALSAAIVSEVSKARADRRSLGAHEMFYLVELDQRL